MTIGRGIGRARSEVFFLFFIFFGWGSNYPKRPPTPASAAQRAVGREVGKYPFIKVAYPTGSYVVTPAHAHTIFVHVYPAAWVYDSGTR